MNIYSQSAVGKKIAVLIAFPWSKRESCLLLGGKLTDYYLMYF